MSFEFLNSVFATFYDFFRAIVEMLSLPLNNLGAYWEYVNPFSNALVIGGLPPFLSEFFELFNNLLFFWAEPILNNFGLTLGSPIWQCLLILIPIIFLFVVLIKIILSFVTPN